ncbi:MAG: Nre family DNA repair protein [Candidatus Thermoplasmatota archaeon]
MIVQKYNTFKSKRQTNFSVSEKPNTNLCGLCRGTKLLCGRERCPVLVKFHSRKKIKPHIDKLKIGGSSPPSVFVGRYGYPKVSVGPMIPPTMGDTSVIDTPELWLDRSIDEIVDFRSMLVRGKYNVDVHDVENRNKNVEFTRELAMSEKSVFTEAIFNKKPRGKIKFYDNAQPHGPSAPLKRFQISNPRWERHVEKAYYDTDLKARNAVINLYEDDVKISQIQKAFSVGSFGEGKYRRFVPTRWSITAVDSMLGKSLREKTKTRRWINDFRVYSLNQFDNRWVILMLPSEWQYELIEAWYPNTTWNPYGKKIHIFNSYEFYEGRKDYADIGGCYYAARLAVNELLNKERRQAGCVIMREAHPGYIMPVGVWNVRESVRKALKQPCRRFGTLDQTLSFISKKMDIPMDRWIKNSALLKHRLYQKRLEDFV